MKFYSIIMLLFIESLLFAQSDLLNVINSFDKSNTIVFVKEYGEDYLFGYRQYSAPKTDRLFIVSQNGQIEKWLDIEIDGFTNFFFLEGIDINDESYLLVSAKTINGNRKLLSIRYKNTNFEIVDSYEVGNIPYGVILYDAYIFDKKNKYMRFSYSKNGSINNEILQIAKDGKIKLIKKLEEIKNSEIYEIKNINDSKEFIILADDGYYVYDYLFNIKTKNQCYFQDKGRYVYITPKTINFNKDSFIVIGTISTGDEKIQKVGIFNNLKLSKGILSADSILLTDKIVLPFESDTTLWNPWSKTSIQGSEYRGFLKGLYAIINGNFMAVNSNKIIIQRVDEKQKPVWTLEFGKENTLFNYAHVKILSDNNLLLWGQVKNYYGNNILNGFYLKLTPSGEIITKTTFPIPTQTEISIHPNPAADHIILNSDYKKKVDFILYNSLGQKVFSKETTMNQTRVDLPNGIPKGNYFYQILGGDEGILNSGKLIVE